VGSAPTRKFSTLLYFSTGCQTGWLHRNDPIRRVLNLELLQFYYGVRNSKLADQPRHAGRGLVTERPNKTGAQVLPDLTSVL